MDLNKLEDILSNAKHQLNSDNSIKDISENIKNNVFSDEQTKEEAKQEFYSQLPNYEKLYQMKNDEYKELISGFSDAYLEICDFYVGPELPREHYLQSKKDVAELYLMFALFALGEPYINAYHDKFG